jgi:hypothetical protein
MRALRAGLAALLALGLWFGAGVAVPRVAVACSCMGPQPLADYAAQGNVILSGQVVADDGEGVQVGVETWFAGPGATPVARLAGDFGNGASCGVGSRPAVGSRWIWVAWRPEPENPVEGMLPADLFISICAPFGDLDMPEGQALLAEARETFGDGAGIPSSPESPGTVPADTPAAPATPAPTASATPADAGPSAEALALGAVVGTLAIGAGVLVVVLLVARRRTTGSRPTAG